MKISLQYVTNVCYFSEEAKGTKRKLSSSEDDASTVKKKEHTSCEPAPNTSSHESDEQNDDKVVNPVISNGYSGLKCIGILPGLGTYDNSSDSDCSSDTDQETEPNPSIYDMLGRKIKVLKEKEKS